MKVHLSVGFSYILVLGLFFQANRELSAQSTPSQPQSGNPATLLSGIAVAFSDGKAVQNIQLTGTATWYAGGEDSGSVTLTAAADGSSQMQLSLASKGQWSESQSAIDIPMTCGWVGNDGVQYAGNLFNCMRPVVWFLPQLFLASAVNSSSITMVDKGVGPVGSAGNYRDLQCSFATSSSSDSVLQILTTASSVDIGVDQSSLLPSILAYEVQPDDGQDVLIPIEIHFSHFIQIDGVQVPSVIQRYVNGALQLEIQISAAQIS